MFGGSRAGLSLLWPRRACDAGDLRWLLLQVEVAFWGSGENGEVREPRERLVRALSITAHTFLWQCCVKSNITLGEDPVPSRGFCVPGHRFPYYRAGKTPPGGEAPAGDGGEVARGPGRGPPVSAFQRGSVRLTEL